MMVGISALLYAADVESSVEKNPNYCDQIEMIELVSARGNLFSTHSCSLQLLMYLESMPE
jgi:hypothetical protein